MKKREVRKLCNDGLFSVVLNEHPNKDYFNAEALGKTGKVDEAIELLESLGVSKNNICARLLYFLGTIRPEKVAELTKDQPFYSDLYHAALSLSDDCEDYQGDDILGIRTALKLGSDTIAQIRLKTYFSPFNLEYPEGIIQNNRLDFYKIEDLNLECEIPQEHKVSIIMCVYNEEDYLSNAVESILKQSYKNLELIIVDDCSTDKTKKAIESFIKTDDRVKAIYQPKNVGLWACKNKGLLESTGDYITAQDADDWSHPRRLERQVSELENNPKLMAYSSYMVRINEADGLPYSRIIHPLLRWNVSSMMFRKEVFGKIGGYYGKLLGGDCEFVDRLEIIYGKKSHKRIKHPHAFGFFRENSLTTNKLTGHNSEGYNQTRQEHWEAWKKYHKSCRKNQKLLYVNPEDNLDRVKPDFLKESE